MEFMSFGPLDRVLEFAGLVTGLACVWLLIRQHIATWPLGIVYVFLSLYIFWEAKLYADFLLHLGFLALNSYGWWVWSQGQGDESSTLPVTRSPRGELLTVLALGVLGTVVFGTLFARTTDAALPYWDNATTAFSLGRHVAFRAQAPRKLGPMAGCGRGCGGHLCREGPALLRAAIHHLLGARDPGLSAMAPFPRERG